MHASRRNFLQTSALAALGSAGLGSLARGSLARAAENVAPPQQPLVEPGSTILFQGDSITDTGREKQSPQPNEQKSLGNGYAMLTATELMLGPGGESLTIHNRGISGNKVPQLDARWQQDCINLKPDVLSILIGVNDIWHKLNGKYEGTAESYQSQYRALLKRTTEALPETKIVICEPFVLKVGAVDDRWFPMFDGYRQAAKSVADEYADAWVPFQSVFDAASKIAEPDFWARDGVHPTVAGSSLMAHAWLKAVGA